MNKNKLSVLMILTFSILIFSSSFFYREPDKLEEAKKLAEGGKIEDAIEIFQKLSSKYAKRDDFQFDWALLYIKKKDYKSAIDHFKLAFTHNSRVPKDWIYYNLGKTFELMKKYKEAMEMYKLALLSNPYNQPARHNLELLLRHRKGRKSAGKSTSKSENRKGKKAKKKKDNKKEENKKNYQGIIRSLENQRKKLPPLNQPIPEGRIDKDW